MLKACLMVKHYCKFAWQTLGANLDFYTIQRQWLVLDKFSVTKVSTIDRFASKLQQIKIAEIGFKHIVKSKLSFSDRWAAEWLKNNRGFIDVPTDKGLGTALMLRSKYDHLVWQQREAAFSPVSESELEHGFCCRAVREIRYTSDIAENMKLLPSAV